jgi:hypothetical protein
MSKPFKTLAQAQAIIDSLEAQLAGKQPVATIAPKIEAKAVVTPESVAAKVNSLSSEKPAVVVGLPTLESLSKQLEACATAADKFAILERAERRFFAEAERLKSNPIEHVKVLRQLARLQTYHAVEKLKDPVAWSRRYSIKNELS